MTYIINKNKVTNAKSYMSFFLIIFLFLSFGILTINGLLTLGDLTRKIYDHPLVVSNTSLHAALNITKMHRNMKDVVLANSTEEIGEALKNVEITEQYVFLQLDIIQNDILGKEGQALEKQTRSLFIKWKPIRDEVVHLLNNNQKKAAIRITKGKGAEHVAQLESKMLELMSYARNKATGFLEKAEKSQSRLENVTITLTVAGVLLSILIAFIATSRLQKAFDEIQTLQGIIPICSYCKKIRDDEDAWKSVEAYITSHSEAQLSHGICPDCFKVNFDDSEE